MSSVFRIQIAGICGELAKASLRLNEFSLLLHLYRDLQLRFEPESPLYVQKLTRCETDWPQQRFVFWFSNCFKLFPICDVFAANWAQRAGLSKRIFLPHSLKCNSLVSHRISLFDEKVELLTRRGDRQPRNALRNPFESGPPSQLDSQTVKI
ncbi:hypothetical protein BKA80DRAFT_256274 [Phyllosticta citrichinensis]